MALEVSINSKRLDVSRSTPIALSFVANDLAELRNRQSNHSNRFKIPITRANREVLELADNLNSDTDIPYKFLEATVTQDGVQIIPNGTFELKQVQSHYEAIILDGNAGFFDRIKNKNIRDLDLSAFNHTWNLTTVIDSKNNTASDGFIYPLINYGTLTSGSNIFDVRDQPASVFLKTIFDQIIIDAGFTKSGNIFTKSVNVGGLLGTNVVMYPNLIIPFSNDDLANAFGTTTNVSDLLPDMTQLDFVKAFMNMFGLFPQTDNVSRNVEFFQLLDVSANKDFANNWSDKMDVSENPLIEYNAGTYAQINRLKYLQDDAVENFGAGELLVDDETIVGDRTLFEVEFAPTIDAPALEIAQIPLINKISGGTFSISTEPRILLMRRGSQVSQLPQSPNGIDYTDGTTTTNISGSDAPYCLFDDTSGPIVSLSFGDTGVGSPNGLISKHYDPEFSSMLLKPKTITQRFKLDQVDISSVDHRIPIFIEKFGEFFYLNRIDKYIGGRLTSVNLKRL